MSTFYIKSNDTSPAIQRTLKDATGTAVNLTGATVVFHMVEKNTDGSLGTTKVNTTANVVTPASGIVQYQWIAADTAVTVDTFFAAEWEVTYSDGTIETFPNSEHETVKITVNLI